MPPRYSYWTIIADGLPTAFRAAEKDELLPTFARIRHKHPDAEMKWFARGKLWDSPESARSAAAEKREADAKRLRESAGQSHSAPGQPVMVSSAESATAGPTAASRQDQLAAQRQAQIEMWKAREAAMRRTNQPTASTRSAEDELARRRRVAMEELRRRQVEADRARASQNQTPSRRQQAAMEPERRRQAGQRAGRSNRQQQAAARRPRFGEEQEHKADQHQRQVGHALAPRRAALDRLPPQAEQRQAEHRQRRPLGVRVNRPCETMLG